MEEASAEIGKLRSAADAIRPLLSDLMVNKGKVTGEVGQLDAAIADFDRKVRTTADGYPCESLSAGNRLMVPLTV